MAFELPPPEAAWTHENGFYLTCQPNLLSKVIAHYALFRMALDMPGAIVECGVFVPNHPALGPSSVS